MTLLRMALAFAMIVVCVGCTRDNTPRPEMRYLVKPMDDGAYLFYIDPNCIRRNNSDLAAFQRDLDKFFEENNRLELKHWKIVRNQQETVYRGASYQISSEIMVFTRPKQGIKEEIRKEVKKE